MGFPPVKCTPELILETPSDTESVTGKNFHKKSNSKIPPPTILPHKSPSTPRPLLSPRPQLSPRPPLSRSGRRASHAGEFISVGRLQAQPAGNTALLTPWRARQHSLGDIDTQEGSYLVRSFAFEGQRMVNKGDFMAFRSRNSSVAE